MRKMQESRPERERKALGGNKLCSDSSEHSGKLMSFLSPISIMGMHRGRDPELEGSLSPEVDMCFWQSVAHRSISLFSQAGFSHVRFPCGQGLTVMKAMWVCVQ